MKRIVSLAVIFTMLLTMFTFPVSAAEDEIIVAAFNSTDTAYTYDKGDLSDDYAVLGDKSLYLNGLNTGEAFTITLNEAITYGEYSTLNMLIYNPEAEKTGLGFLLSYGDKDGGDSKRASYGSFLQYFEPGWQLVSGTISTKKVGNNIKKVYIRTTQYDLLGTAYPYNHNYDASHHGGETACTCAGTTEGHCACSSAVGTSKLVRKQLYIAGVWLSKSSPDAITSTPSIASGAVDIPTNTESYRVSFSKPIISSSASNAVKLYNGETEITEGITKTVGADYVDIAFEKGTLKTDKTYTVKVANTVMGHRGNPYQGAEYTFTTRAFDTDAVTNITTLSEGDVLKAGENVILGAEVTTSSDISHIEFWANGEKLPGVISGTNGTMIWYAPKAGNYQLVAKAVLANGYSVASMPVNVVAAADEIVILKPDSTNGIGTYNKGVLSDNYAVLGNKSIYISTLQTGYPTYVFTPDEDIAYGDYTTLNMLIYNPETEETGLGFQVNYVGLSNSSLRASYGSFVQNFEPGWQLISGTMNTSRIGTPLQSVNISTTGYDMDGMGYPLNHNYNKNHHGGEEACTCAGTTEGHCGCTAAGRYKFGSKSFYIAGVWLSKDNSSTAAVVATPSIPNGYQNVPSSLENYRIKFSTPVVQNGLANAVTVYDGQTAITEGITKTVGNDYVDITFAEGTLANNKTYTVKVANTVMGYRGGTFAGGEYTFVTKAEDGDNTVPIATVTYPANNAKVATTTTFATKVLFNESVKKVEFVNAETLSVMAEAVATSNGEYVATNVELAAEQTHTVKAAVTLNDDTVIYSEAISVETASANEYKITGIADGDHIVVAAETSRKIKVIDASSSADPDDLKNQKASNVGWVDFKVDGNVVKTVRTAPFEYNLEFGTAYGEHTLEVDVYDSVGYKKSYGPFKYTALADKFDDTFLSCSTNFDTDTDGSSLHGGSCTAQSKVENGALVLGDGTEKSKSVKLHPLASSLPRDNEVYYMEFDFKTDRTSMSTNISVRDGYQSGDSAIVAALKAEFTSNKVYKFKIVLDFYSNTATTFVDGEYYSRTSLDALDGKSVGNFFVPEISVHGRTLTIDNFKFSAYGYRTELPEPTYSDDKPVIIFRCDDFGKMGTLGAFKKVAYLFDKYNATGGFGIVGNWFLENNEEQQQVVVDAGKEFIKDGIEIWHHGYLHSTTEYNENKGDPIETMKENFGKNMDLVEERFGVTMQSFGSPYNHAGPTALGMIQENYPEITSASCLDKDPENIATIPRFNTRCQIEADTGIIGSQAFITNFQNTRTQPYLLVLSHPGYWDDGELSEFELILRYLNASGVTYMTQAQAAEDYVASKTYELKGIEDGDRIVVAKEPTRKVKIIDADADDNMYTPVANKSAKATLVSSVDFMVDGEVAYTAKTAPFEYDLPFNDYGVHTLKAVVHETAGTTKTYGPYTYTTLEATIDNALTVEEDFTTSQDASAIHGGVYGSGMSFTVENGVLKATATGGSYTMNLHPAVDELSVQDRIYFMEYDIMTDSNAYQTRLYMNDATADGYTRTAFEMTKNFDYALNQWYNVKVMIDPGKKEAITYVDNVEYRRTSLTHFVREIFIPQLMANRRNVYLDNYKFYAYDLAEKTETTNPIVILRFDDLKPGVIDAFESAIAVLDEYDIEASCGVIGHQLGDEALYEAISNFHANGAEIWHHGYEHTGTEFQGATAESVIENYGKTANLIKDNCGITITSFCPGYNNLDSVAIRALQENYPELKCVMSSQDSEDAATRVVNLRATTTFEGTGTSSKIDVDGFKASFEVLKHNEYVVIYCHPGSWKTGDLDKFDEVIKYLREQNVTFMTPSQAADRYNATYKNPNTHIAKLAVNNDGLLYLSSKNVPETSTVYVAAYDDENRFMYATTITFENGIAQERIDLEGVDCVQAFIFDDDTVAPDCDAEDYRLN